MTIQEEVRYLRQQVALIQQRLNGIRGSAIGQHNILSADHPDAAPGAVAEGSMIRGNATPEWEEFSPGAEDDVLKITGGIPDWGAPGGVSDEGVAFLDNFADASIYWLWKTAQTTAQKTITEAGTALTIHVDNGTACDWAGGSFTSPIIYLGADPPCEYIVKVTSFHATGKRAEIFIAKTLAAGANAYFFGIVDNGIHLTLAGTADYGVVGDLTVPVWLKIRLSGDQYNWNNITFWYSTDGVAWTQYVSGAHTSAGVTGFGGYDGLFFGMLVRSTGATAQDAVYDFAEMIRVRGPR
jgi:hypothetical protein